MKLPILLIICILLSIDNIKAQNLDFGITASSGLSKVVASKFYSAGLSQKFGFSYNFGIYLNQKIGKKSSLELELQLSHIRGVYTYDAQRIQYPVFVGNPDPDTFNVNGTGKYLFNYLSLPISYKYEINKLSLIAGFQFMRMLKGKSVNSEKGPSTTTGEIRHFSYGGDITKGLNKIDYGLKAGLQYNFVVRLKIRLLYYHSFTNVSKNELLGLSNRQATIGLQYSLTKSISNSAK